MWVVAQSFAKSTILDVIHSLVIQRSFKLPVTFEHFQNLWTLRLGMSSPFSETPRGMKYYVLNYGTAPL